ncbi:MAG: hypothetical protein Q8M09_08105 [Pseudomonadota bacterium]|nr:hypothetical protein [Pseudomonadota bacterium]
MNELDPSAMAVLAQWLLNNGLVFGAGVLVGSLVSLAVVAAKLFRLRREGVI